MALSFCHAFLEFDHLGFRFPTRVGVVLATILSTSAKFYVHTVLLGSRRPEKEHDNSVNITVEWIDEVQ